uniref:Serine hydrolase FSH domain-containing protein n=1 Tax=Arcella intermedia TaxID=1963864 RepID=A0A6B2LPU9_9EUKA
MVRDCVKIQEKSLRDFKPDVVVASSFGGAIAIECIKKGYWKGPTILLAPAQKLVAEKAGQPHLGQLPAIIDFPIHVYHGTSDKIVPCSHSEELGKHPSGLVKTKIYKGDDHVLSLHINKTELHKLIHLVYNQKTN